MGPFAWAFYVVRQPDFSRASRSLALLSIAFVVLVAACSSDSTGPAVTSVVVSPSSVTLEVDGTTALSAQGRDASGGLVTGLPFVWSSDNADVASVGSDGTVTGRAPGTAQVHATADGVRGSASVMVILRPVASVEVTPSTPELVMGETLQLAARALASNGDLLTDRSVSWGSDAPGVAAVDGEGLVTAMAEGSAVVRAAVGGVSGSASVSVAPRPVASLEISGVDSRLWRGQTAMLEVTARNSLGEVVPSPALVWSSSAEGVATVSEDGEVMGVSAGAAQVTAAVGAVQASLSLEVLPYMLGDGLRTIAAGRTHTCAVAESGDVWCWGDGTGKALGQGDDSTQGSLVPVRVEIPGGAVAVAAGASVSCALNGEGAAYCWGTRTRIGSPASGGDVGVPTPVQGGLRFVSIVAMMYHACGLTSSGALYCWGYSTFGQLGNGSIDSRDGPTLVASEAPFGSVAAGIFHTCGVTTDLRPYCWGFNKEQQLGDGTATERWVPTAVAASAGTDFVDAAAGEGHSCALATDGTPWCWGTFSGGPVEPGPVAGGPPFALLVAGDDTTCGLTEEGRLYCWGDNGSGQLGVGPGSGYAVPTEVSGGRSWTAVDANDIHTCGITRDGEAYCWGWGGNGRLGDGTTQERSVPAMVVGAIKFSTGG